MKMRITALRRPLIKLVEHGAFIGQLRPNAITIDAEGAELIVLQGAKRTLLDTRPLVWVRSTKDGLTAPASIPKIKMFWISCKDWAIAQKEASVDHESTVMFRPR